MRRPAALLAFLLVLAIPASVAPGAYAAPAPPGRNPGTGLPSGVPPAARRPEPRLPAPAGWPFAEAFSRASGTARHHGGALFWTDFLYDDNGAVGADLPIGESTGAVAYGTYGYPEAAQAGNGADVFRAAVGLTATDTWWRVDWNTLVDPRVPIAAFGIDADASGSPAVPWPANVGVSSAGLDRLLVVSGTGAWLVDALTATATPVAALGGTHLVDVNARSFVVRLPRSAFAPPAASTLWLAGGLADAEGDAFLALGPAHRHLPGQPHVYNLGFRGYEDEPLFGNFWMERAQATALSAPNADVTAFSLSVDWTRLAARSTERQPLVRGHSNRWYVSSVELGPGRITAPESTADNEPNYLGRVQPYSVYVPASYVPGDPAPLTWILHSFTINHNQYGGTAPQLLQDACEARGSICATTLGRGPDGQYRNVAELDFWEVWRTLAAAFTLDAERTIVGGYSMGGFGTVRLAENHPDLFAGMFLLASAAEEDLPRLENLRWTPYYHAHGVEDQLVNYATEARPTVDELDRLGYRYRFDTYPTKDHVAWSLEDGWYLAAEWTAEGDRTRPRDPGHITYRWFPADVMPDLGIGPTGAWWLRGLRARDPAAAEARVDATSRALPEPAITAARSQASFIDANGNLVHRAELAWTLGSAPTAQQRIDLDLDNVGFAKIHVPRSGLLPGSGAQILIDTDGPLTLVLRALPEGIPVFLDGRRAGTGASRVVVPVPAGEHRIAFTRGV